MAPDMSNFATAWGFFGTLAWIIQGVGGAVWRQVGARKEAADFFWVQLFRRQAAGDAILMGAAHAGKRRCGDLLRKHRNDDRAPIRPENG